MSVEQRDSAVDLLDSSSTVNVLKRVLTQPWRFRVAQDGGSGPAISFVDTVIANHTGSVVACGGDMRSIDAQEEHAQAAVRFQRCAVVQNHSPHAGNERTTNSDDAVIDLGSCVAPVPVHVGETVWLDNAIAVVHRDGQRCRAGINLHRQ